MRSMMAALLLVTVMTGTSAAEHLGDVRLAARKLSGSEGSQKVQVSGRLARSAAVRVVTATVTAGDTIVTLTGKVAKNGKWKAKATNVGLAAALASFTRIDVEPSNGEFELVTLTPDECRRSANGHSLDCGSRRGSGGVLVEGAYDFTITSAVPPVSTGAASLGWTGFNGHRFLFVQDSAYSWAQFSLADDDDVTGLRVVSHDIGLEAVGTSVNASTPSASIVHADVTLTSNLFPPQDFAVTLRRDRAGTPAALGGAWQLALSGPGPQPINGTMGLAFTVPPNGITEPEPTTIEQASGPRYILSSGDCLVAPSGGLRCWMDVTDPPGIYVVLLTGTLDRSAGTGHGEFVSGLIPGGTAKGTWTATR